MRSPWRPAAKVRIPGFVTLSPPPNPVVQGQLPPGSLNSWGAFRIPLCLSETIYWGIGSFSLLWFSGARYEPQTFVGARAEQGPGSESPPPAPAQSSLRVSVLAWGRWPVSASQPSCCSRYPCPRVDPGSIYVLRVSEAGVLICGVEE